MARRPQSMACADSCHLGFCLCTTKGLHSRNWPFQPAVKLFSTFSSSALPTLLNALSHSQLVASLQPLPSSSSQTCRVDFFFWSACSSCVSGGSSYFWDPPIFGGNFCSSLFNTQMQPVKMTHEYSQCFFFMSTTPYLHHRRCISHWYVSGPFPISKDLFLCTGTSSEVLRTLDRHFQTETMPAAAT